jgi:3'-phosphoadenosine 5'-phosphosulfate sulfotransferase (PAPS reductase)/FAD synthetase
MTYVFPPLAITPMLSELLTRDAPLAIGVSGGKDSDVAAFEVQAHRHTIGHKGPAILIHSDLGRVEHKAPLPVCERLAARLGLELLVVKRQKGDLMDRWLTRWQDNLQRYRQLRTVKLILPWSTPAMRFCTSELKTAVMCRALVERYPGQTIVSVAGIRRQESARRAKTPICVAQPKLSSATYQTQGYSWHPLLAWSVEDVLAYHRARNFPLHEAYTTC